MEHWKLLYMTVSSFQSIKLNTCTTHETNELFTTEILIAGYIVTSCTLGNSIEYMHTDLRNLNYE